MRTKLRYVLSLSMVFVLFSANAQQDYWQVTEKKLANDKTISRLNDKFFTTHKLDIDRLKSVLQGAPLRTDNTVSNTIVYFPNGDGVLEEFKVVEAPIISDELVSLFPNVKTYLGFSTKNPGTRVRFSVTPQGLQTMISSANYPLVFTVPISKNNTSSYITYSRDAKGDIIKDFECFNSDTYPKSTTNNMQNRDANDQLLRTFRIAISTTGEYTNFWDDGNIVNGNAQQDAFAQVVATLNRTIEVFEVDMAISFTLVSGLNIIFPNAGSDPYTGNFSPQLQSTLTSNVGEANYDVGHLFAYLPGGSSGSAGCIGCVCDNGQKGRGWSGHTFLDNDGGPYMNDFFDIDYVPHEIGHQLGANHTWSFSSEGTGVNAEPGSGTTIMGYAGITGINDVQDHSDAYFHYYSILQILNNLQTKTCWTSTVITNNPPVADAGPDYTIPNGTPFVLRGSATDADTNDVLFYNWEQIDNGVTTSGNFGPTKTTGAVWRSRPPSLSPDRFMPFTERVLTNQLTQTNPIETDDNSSWETVSTTGRTLNFALIVRDRTEAGGIGQSPQTSYDTMQVTVDGVSGPFVVTSQSTNETWDAGSNQTVTWNVAGTNAGAVNTPNVNILLSIDGGFTYPFTLATNVPNDGTQDITVPNTGNTSLARVKVEGNNNIFYAINSTNFTIQASEFVLNVADPMVDVCAPNDAVFNFTYNTFLGFNGTTTFSTTGLPPGATAVFSPPTASADGTNVTVTVSGIGSLALGNYPFTLVGTSGGIVKTADVSLTVFDGSLSTLSLITPSSGQNDVPADNATFTWSVDANASSYEIEIATDAAFGNIIITDVVTTAGYTATTLMTQTAYFWRVRPVNACGNGNFSADNFTTANISCASYDATDTPINIPDANVNGADSVINVPTTSLITDINVTVNLTHTFTGDLILTLIAPDGTSIILSNRNGGNGENYSTTIFDQEASNAIGAGTAPFTGSFLPDGDLSVLYGTFSGGDWTLNVSDNAGFDTGSIDSWTLEICGSPQTDTDMDGIPDNSDNCPSTANADQSDLDNDGIGDVCDDDMDNDGILNISDNCPMVANAGQEDSNNNGIGDACEVDCTIVSAADTPIDMPPGVGTDTYTSLITVANDLEITDVNVTINIPHAWVSDLDITLTSPAGTTVELTTDNGGDGDNYTNTVFDSESTNPITAGTPPFTGTFAPEGDLSILNGEFTAGDWVLTVVDDFEAEDGGIIEDFTLELCTIGTLSTQEFSVESGFRIYPNPNNGEFTVRLINSNSDQIDIQLYDVNGRRIFKNKYNLNGDFTTVINLGSVQAGVYLVYLNDGTRQLVERLIIQ